MTCRQVYDEAWQFLCRYCRIRLARRYEGQQQDVWAKSLHSTLRLFPTYQLQRVSVLYSDFLRDYMQTYTNHIPGEVFVNFLRDAYTLKHFFPKLREFTVTWDTNQYFFVETERLIFWEAEERRIETWLGWMRKWVQLRHVVPLAWVNFEFANKRGHAMQMQRYAGTMNGAYQRLVLEMAPLADEEKEI